ncbi:ACP S-malonyltransferase [Acetobacteraceae bacterium]|nr:ACP S-malonyltransferase [Acetobacteraceae bacterium]
MEFKHAFVFPGQGSQFTGMGKELFEESSVAREVFEEVNDALKERLSDLIFEGSQEDLTKTSNTQPALFAVSMAVLRVLEKEGGFSISEKASALAGHSLGEYAALAAAGALSISEGAHLLRLRGEAMQSAVPSGKGGMAAILGISHEQALEMCDTLKTFGRIEIANDNGGGQIVLSGDLLPIEKSLILGKEKGAKKTVLLAVSAPFHSSLMHPAAEKMSEAFSQLTWEGHMSPVWANITAQPEHDIAKVPDLLTRQITGSVRWRETIESFVKDGITHHHELGAGKTLTGLAKRIDSSLQNDKACTMQEIEAMLERIFNPTEKV